MLFSAPSAYSSQLSNLMDFAILCQPDESFPFCYCPGVFTRHSVNLALNRPTWQSSILTNISYTSTPRLSWYAVDGINRTDLSWCACTADGDTSPWWAVDLGLKTYIYRVALTNRDSDSMSPIGLFCIIYVEHALYFQVN